MSYHFPKEKSTTQRCARCKVTKKLEEFPPHPGRKNKVGHYCEHCEHEYQKRFKKMMTPEYR